MAKERLPIPECSQRDAFDRRGMMHARFGPDLSVIAGNASFDAVFPRPDGALPTDLRARLPDEITFTLLQSQASRLTPDKPRSTMPLSVGDSIYGIDTVGLFRPDGTLAEIEIVAADMTSQIARRDAREQMILDLQAKLRDSDAFAATAAHDLKNPLHAIAGMLELVLDMPAMTVEQNKVNLEMAMQSALRGTRIIDDILAFSRIDRTEIKSGDTDLELSAQMTMQEVAVLAEKVGGQISIQRDMPHVIAHAEWVERVMANLIGNALKYGGQSSRVEVTADVMPDGMVRCSVRDFGPGIRPEDQGKLFKPFSRLHSSDVEGTGLGLSTVSRVVARMGGTAGVESTGVDGEGHVLFHASRLRRLSKLHFFDTLDSWPKSKSYPNPLPKCEDQPSRQRRRLLSQGSRCLSWRSMADRARSSMQTRKRWI